jgi:hypothetical protein
MRYRILRLVNNFLIIISCCILSSCAAHKKISASSQSPLVEPVSAVESNVSISLENVNPDEMDGYAHKKGVVFAKTDFQGLLKTSYVRLLIESVEDTSQSFYLHVGGGAIEAGLPWEVKRVEPGYFFIELPAGEYKMSSVAIPYGSTLASEVMNIFFDVASDEITYIGTLRLVGTKEKIKLGGLPVIKPGFEFDVEIIDETQEGFNAFKERYPKVSGEIKVKIMFTQGEIVPAG